MLGMIFLGWNWSSRTSPFSPNGLRNWSGSSALAAQGRIFWGCLMGSCCVQEGKGACPLIIVRWALRNIREVQTMDFWESVQHRNGECRARGEKASCACLCHLPFSFSFPPLLCLYFLATLNNVKKKPGWSFGWCCSGSFCWEFIYRSPVSQEHEERRGGKGFIWSESH